MTNFHRDAPLGDIHVPFDRSFDNAGQRDSFAWQATDVGKLVRVGVSSPFQYFFLESVTPVTFVELTTGGPVTQMSKAALVFGAGSLTSTVTDRFLYPGFDAAVATTLVASIRAPYAGVLRNLYVRHTAAGAGGTGIVYTVRVNGVASALSVTLAAAANDGNNLVAAVNVAAGASIDVLVGKNSALGSTPQGVLASFEYEAS